MNETIKWRLFDVKGRKILYFTIQIVCIFCSLCYLCNTDSYYASYVIFGVLGVLALVRNIYSDAPRLPVKKKKLYVALSIMLMLCVTLSNYQLIRANSFATITNTTLLWLYAAYKAFWIMSGSFFTALNILTVVDRVCNQRKTDEIIASRVDRVNEKKLAIVCYLIFICIDLSVLFLCNYPGNLSPDSISQMTQILSGNYSNHHPFWHTMIIKCCVTLGLWVFGNINTAVACYSVFQILFLGACFTYCISTLYQIGISRVWVIASIAFYAIMPYHIAYSMTMWKDVPFGGAVLLFSASMLRILKSMGTKKWLNWFCLLIGSMGMCLWRSNGWVAFAVTVLIFAVVFLRRYRPVVILLFSVLVVTYVMINPILSRLNVDQPDPIESLSIPAQQIARAITAGKELSATDKELLSQIVEIEKIPETYKDYISDPIKNLVRQSANQDYLLAHKADYFKLWISIGVRYPMQYIAAWVDQTKGYWNGGYKYWIWSDEIIDNQLGIERGIVSPIIDTLKKAYYLGFSVDSSVFALFRSVGLCTWLFAGYGTICLANNRKKEAILAIPILAIVATLCIATPVFCEFRYDYAAFTCLPLITCVTVKEHEKGKNHG